MHNKTLQRAHMYADRGWRVFPVTPGDKDPPLVKWRLGNDTDDDLRERRAPTRRWSAVPASIRRVPAMAMLSARCWREARSR